MKKTVDYYIIKLENIQTYMENIDYYNRSYTKKIITTKHNIFNKGLTKENIKEVEEINNFFMENVYTPTENNLSEKISNVWSNYKNELRGK